MTGTTGSTSAPHSNAAADAAVMQQVLASGILSDDRIVNETGINPANQGALSYKMANKGLVMGFLVRVVATINNTAASGGAALTATEFGPANIFDKIVFTDYDSNTRINVAARNLMCLNALRHNGYLGSGINSYDKNGGDLIPSTGLWPVASWPLTIAAAASATVEMWFYVPLARAPHKGDFRGAMFAQISGKTATLTFNFQAAATAIGSDVMRSAYTGSTGTVTNVGIEIFQQYYDNLPLAPNGAGYLMAPISWSTLYQMLDGPMGDVLTAADFTYFDFTTVREYYGVMLTYNNANVLNQGSDVTEMQFFRNITQPTRTWTPKKLALETRRLLSRNDLPSGCYFFDFDYKPVSLSVYGNSRLGFKPAAVTAGALLYKTEEFILPQTALPLVMG